MKKTLLSAVLGLTFGAACCAQAPPATPLRPSVDGQGKAAMVFEPPFEPSARFICEDLPALRKQWPNLAIGRMFEALELERIVAQRMDASDRQRELGQRTRKAAVLAKLELEPQAASLVMRTCFEPLGPWHRLQEVERIDAMVQQLATRPRLITTNRIAPDAVAAWEQRLAADVEWSKSAGWFDVRSIDPEGPTTGRTMHLNSALRERELAKASPRYANTRFWTQRLGRTFVFGSDDHEDFGSFRPEAKPRAAGVHLEFLFSTFRDIMKGEPDLQQLMTELGQLRISIVPEGDQLREVIQLEVAVAENGRNLLELVDGSDPCIAQALPKGAILQFRADLELVKLADMASDLFGEQAMLLDAAAPLLDGRMALGLTAPAKGGLIPRIYLTLGVAKPTKLAEFLNGLVAMAQDSRKVTYGGIECTILPIPGLPQGVQPTFCHIDNRLHVAESPLSMRAFLKAQTGGATAMPVADAVQPELTTGKQLAGADLRCDLAQLYRTLYDVWLPLYQLSDGLSIGFDDLPDPDEVDEHIGALHGVFGRDDDRLTMAHVGPVGGPFTGAYLILGGTMLPSTMQTSSSVLRSELAKQKLENAWQILQDFEQRHQRRPRDLAEFFLAGALPDDALLMPGDESPEVLELPGKRRVSVSFRYFPEPAAVSIFSRKSAVLFIECAARGTGRYVLEDNGRARSIWGDDARKPIDSFGK